MRMQAIVGVLVVGLVAGLVSVRADDKKDGAAAAAFERLKKLDGEWTRGEGKGVSTRYSVVSHGSVVMEVMAPGKPFEMITMYHLDKDDLVLTHYCAHGNQPRMKAKLPFDGKKLAFEFAGGTNFDPAKDVHMHEVTFTFTDDDHFGTAWISYENGAKKGDPLAYEYTRLKK